MSEDNLEQTGLPEGNDPAVEPQQTDDGSAAGSDATDYRALAERYKQQLEGWQQQAGNLQNRLSQQEQYLAAIAQQMQQTGQLSQKQQETVEEYATAAQAKALNEAVLTGDDDAVSRIMNDIATRAAAAGAKQGASEAARFWQDQQQRQQMASNAFGWANDPKYQILKNPSHPIAQKALSQYQQWAADPSNRMLYQPVEVGGATHYPALLKMAVDQATSQMRPVGQSDQFVDLASSGASSPQAPSRTPDATKPPPAFVRQMGEVAGIRDPKEVAEIWGSTNEEERAAFLAAK